MKKVLFNRCFKTLLLLCIINNTLIAQNALQDLKIATGKMESQKFKLHLKYVLYETYTSKQSVEEKNFHFSTWGDNVNVSVEGVDNIETGGKSLYVDHRQKVMILKTKVPNQRKMASEALNEMVNIDSLIKSSIKIALLKKDADNKVYRFTYPQGSMYNYVDVTIDVRTGLIDKMCSYYASSMDDLLNRNFERSANGKQQPRLEIVFSAYEFPTSKSKTDFLFSKFLTKRGNVYVVSAEYTSYEFFDYTSKRKK